MTKILILAGILVALKVLQPVLRVLIAAVAAKPVGRRALEKQPDTVHLTPADQSAWKDRAAVGAIAGGFRPLGFEDAGTYAIDELRGVTVRLLVNSAESSYASIYEHPKAGVWFDIVTRYADGTSATFSSARPTGLGQRPGHSITNFPNQSAVQVFEQARATRPQGVFAGHAADRVARDFETAFAESMAWRKGNGFSTREVVNVAMRPRKAA